MFELIFIYEGDKSYIIRSNHSLMAQKPQVACRCNIEKNRELVLPLMFTIIQGGLKYKFRFVVMP